MRRVRLGLILLAVLAVAVAAAVVAWRLRPSPARVSIYLVRVNPATQQGELVPVTRDVPRGDARSLVAAAMEELLRGPSAPERAGGLVSEIPEGTRLRGVTVKDGVAFVDLSRQVERGGGAFSVQARLWQIVYTATQFPDAPRARLIIEGEAKETFTGEGLMIDGPLARPQVPPRL